MNSFTTRVITTMSAAALAFTPVAAQANTRAGDFSTSYSAPSVQGTAFETAEGFWFGEEEEVGMLWLAILGGAVALIGLVLAGGGGGGSSEGGGGGGLNQSPGAN